MVCIAERPNIQFESVIGRFRDFLAFLNDTSDLISLYDV